RFAHYQQRRHRVPPRGGMGATTSRVAVIAACQAARRCGVRVLKEDVMKGSALLLIITLCLACPTDVWADEHDCSLETLRGAFGFTFTGTAKTATGTSQRGGIGRYVIDGEGNIGGAITSNADGV